MSALQRFLVNDDNSCDIPIVSLMFIGAMRRGASPLVLSAKTFCENLHYTPDSQVRKTEILRKLSKFSPQKNRNFAKAFPSILRREPNSRFNVEQNTWGPQSLESLVFWRHFDPRCWKRSGLSSLVSLESPVLY